MKAIFYFAKTKIHEVEYLFSGIAPADYVTQVSLLFTDVAYSYKQEDKNWCDYCSTM